MAVLNKHTGVIDVFSAIVVSMDSFPPAEPAVSVNAAPLGASSVWLQLKQKEADIYPFFVSQDKNWLRCLDCASAR